MSKNKQLIHPSLKTGIFIISGNTGTGKTTAATGLVNPKNTIYVTFDAKGHGPVHYAKYYSLAPELLVSDVHLVDQALEVFDEVVQLAEKDPKKYQALVVEDWPTFRAALSGWSEINAGKLRVIFGGGNHEAMQKRGYAKKLEKARIASFRRVFPLVVLTAQLRHRYYDYYEGGKRKSVKTETMVPDVTQEAKEAADHVLMLLRMREQMTPSALVLKQCWPPVWDDTMGASVPAGMLPEKLDIRALGEEPLEQYGGVSMLPIWAIMSHYLTAPLTAGHVHEEYEIPSPREKAVITDTLTMEERTQAVETLKAQERQREGEVLSMIQLVVHEKPGISPIAIFKLVKEEFPNVTMGDVQRLHKTLGNGGSQ